MDNNYYELLELNQNSSVDEIKAQLKKAKRLWNNRKNAPTMEARQEAERKVELIQLAEKVFIDENAKLSYDKSIAPKVKPNNQTNNNQRNFNQNNNQQNFNNNNQNNNQQNFNNQNQNYHQNNQQNFNQNNNQNIDQLLTAFRGMMNSLQYENAIQTGNRILELQPNNANVLNSMAICYNSLGKSQNNSTYKSNAIKLSERSINIEPSLLHLVNASLFCRQGNAIDRCESFLARAEKIDSNHESVRRERVYLASAKYDYDKAIAFSLKLTKDFPQEENYKTLLVDAYIDKAYSLCLYNKQNKLYYIINETMANAMRSYSNMALRILPNNKRALNAKEWVEKQSKKSLNKDALWLLIVPLALFNNGFNLIDQLLTLILTLVIISKSYQPRWYTTRINQGFSKLWIDVTLGAKTILPKIIVSSIVFTVLSSVLSNLYFYVGVWGYAVVPLVLCILVSKYDKIKSK